jgi:phage/plasmid-associated DNA primase
LTIDELFSWMVAGARRWYTSDKKLAPPCTAREALQAYIQEHDHVPDFISDVCERGDFSVKSTVLYEAYKSWCTRQSINPMAVDQWSNRLRREGLVKVKSSGMVWKGLRISSLRVE